MIARIDHVILDVPDIHRAHARLREKGWPEAWPIGRFWPAAQTSGVALGGINLELVQSDESPSYAGGDVVFEPVEVEAAQAALEREGISARRFEKIEEDPEKLALRGFPHDLTAAPQLICTNVLPNAQPPFGFFFCAYAPFLRDWLSPSHPRLQTQATLAEIVLAAEDPEAAKSLVQRLGRAKDISLRFVRGARGLYAIRWRHAEWHVADGLEAFPLPTSG